MKTYSFMRSFTEKLLVLMVVLLSTTAHSSCEKILQYGIYDERNTLALWDKYQLAHNMVCRESGSTSDTSAGLISEIVDLSFGSDSESFNNFCKSSAQEAYDAGLFIDQVRSINSNVVQSWSQCMKQDVNQVVHSISPISESEFTYKIVFKRESDSDRKHVKVERWKHNDNVSCNGTIEKGDRLTQSGITLICERKDVTQPAIITADTEDYSALLKEASLYGKRERAPAPYVERLKDHIEAGKRFVVSFDKQENDTECGVKGTPLGNFKTGGTPYTVYYVPATQLWVTEGPLQSYGGCATHSSIGDGNYHKFDRDNPTMNLWVALMTFDDKGHIYWAGSKVGKIHNPF